jgi:hypothetical protein
MGFRHATATSRQTIDAPAYPLDFVDVKKNDQI